MMGAFVAVVLAGCYLSAWRYRIRSYDRSSVYFRRFGRSRDLQFNIKNYPCGFRFHIWPPTFKTGRQKCSINFGIGYLSWWLTEDRPPPALRFAAEGDVVYVRGESSDCICCDGVHVHAYRLSTDSPVYGGDGWRDHVHRVIRAQAEGAHVRILVEVLP